MRKAVSGIVFLIFSFTPQWFYPVFSQEITPVCEQAYFVRKPPKNRPAIFERQISPAIRIYSYYEFLADGSLFFFKGSSSSLEGVFIMGCQKGSWTKPQLVLPAASDVYEDRHFFLTPDKKRIFFTSRRPRNSREKYSENPNIWVMENKSGAWTQPRPLESPVNSDSAEYYTTLTLEGTLYFTRSSKDEGCDIFRSELQNSRYSEVERLDSTINSDSIDGDPYIAPDESYLIFLSDRPGGMGQHDFYISFRTETGEWTKPLHLGKEINSSGNDVCPLVTADGRYFFFNSNRSGNWNIYWVDAGFVNEFKKAVFKTLQ